MNKTRTYIIWAVMAAVVALIAYLIGADWYWAVLTGILFVAALVGSATFFMYRKQKKLLDNAAKFNIDLKAGKVHPADLRRMYFSGGQNRKDALLIASRAMNCSVQEAEKKLSEKITRESAARQMAGQNQARFRGRPR